MEREALLAALARIIAPSGCETAAAQYLLEKLAGICDGTWTDGAGNLIFKMSSGETRGKGRLMLAAHMDECGFMIKNIDTDGRARIAVLGNLDTRTLSGRRISMTSGVRGVVISRNDSSLKSFSPCRRMQLPNLIKSRAVEKSPALPAHRPSR